MTCNQTQDKLIDWLRGDLSDHEAMALEAHCESCEACREAKEALSMAWDGLTEWPNESPSPALKHRFDAMLSAYESGLSEKVHHVSLADHLDHLIGKIWPKRPVWQMGLAAAALLVGLWAGQRPAQKHDQRLASLEAQVGNMQTMVALTLHTAQSSSQRLEALTLASQIEHPQKSLIRALLTTLKQDPSTNVRLAAVDALARFVELDEVKSVLNEPLSEQSSPLVQTALINLMALSGQEQTLNRAAQNTALDPVVRAHARKKLDAMI